MESVQCHQVKIDHPGPDVVALVWNPSYLGGGAQENHSLGKKLARPHLNQ
jgi:hypothetical protein